MTKLVFAMLVVVGCHSSATWRIIHGPNGGDAAAISCWGLGATSCYEAAGRACHAGYDVLLADDRGSLLVECKLPAPALTPYSITIVERK
jgi:hypothetical protein